MTKTKPIERPVTPDAAHLRDDDAAFAQHMNTLLAADDPDQLLDMLRRVARAKGMTQVARDAGLGRESLYKTLAPGAKPRFQTVMKLARALGVRFTAQPG